MWKMIQIIEEFQSTFDRLYEKSKSCKPADHCPPSHWVKSKESLSIEWTYNSNSDDTMSLRETNGASRITIKENHYENILKLIITTKQ
jgi:hypothetical protein